MVSAAASLFDYNTSIFSRQSNWLVDGGERSAAGI